MTDTTEPTRCPECGFCYGAHDETCSALRRYPFYSPNPDCRPPREAEYRRVWLERAGAIFDKESGFASDGRCDARLAFDAADMFLAELRKRDKEWN